MRHMDATEFRMLVREIEAQWQGDDPPPSTYSQMFEDLRPFPAVLVQAAVLSFSREGRSRMPTSGMIRRRILELQVDAPPWGEAQEALLAARRRYMAWPTPQECSVSVCDGSGWIELPRPYEHGSETVYGTEAGRCGCVEVNALARRKATALKPVLRDFVALVGWQTIGDLAHGDGMVQAQTRNKYEEFVKSLIDTASLVGIDAPGLTAVERANREVGKFESIGDTVKRALLAAGDTVPLVPVDEEV